MSYYEGSNWQARKEDEGKTLYDKNDLTHKHLNDICVICGVRRGLHSNKTGRCPAKGTEEISSAHTLFRDTTFSAIPIPKEDDLPTWKHSEIITMLMEYAKICRNKEVVYPNDAKDFYTNKLLTKKTV